MHKKSIGGQNNIYIYIYIYRGKNIRGGLGKKKGINELDQRYGDRSNIGVIICSGGKESMGRISNSNNQIKVILGYNAEELIDNNISKLLPSGKLRTKHESWMLQYLVNQKATTQNTLKITFAESKQGFLIPVHILRNIVPNLQNGIQLITFIGVSKYIDDFRLGDELLCANMQFFPLFLLDKHFNMLSMSQAVCTILQIDPLLIDMKKYKLSTKKLNLGKIYPGIINMDNFPQLSSLEGLYVNEFEFFKLKGLIISDVLEFSNTKKIRQKIKRVSENRMLNRTITGESVDEVSKVLVDANLKFRNYHVESTLTKKATEFSILSIVWNNEHLHDSSYNSEESVSEKEIITADFDMIINDAASMSSCNSCTIYIYIYINPIANILIL